MAKFYKIKVLRDGTKFVYPSGFVNGEKGIGRKVLEHLYFDERRFMLVALPDNIKFEHDNVTELTLEEAEAIATEHETQQTQITDEGMVRLIEIKSRLGTKLTAKEKKAIDLDDDTPGIKWKKSLKNKLRELK
jgi:hypothetical protein